MSDGDLVTALIYETISCTTSLMKLHMYTYGTSSTTISSLKITPDNIKPQLDNTTTARQQLDNNLTVARQHIGGQPLRPFVSNTVNVIHVMILLPTQRTTAS
jgi:hypothetical protein